MGGAEEEGMSSTIIALKSSSSEGNKERPPRSCEGGWGGAWPGKCLGIVVPAVRKWRIGLAKASNAAAGLVKSFVFNSCNEFSVAGMVSSASASINV